MAFGCSDHIHVFMQRRRRTNIRAQVVVSFEEAAKGAKRTIRVAQGVPTPQNVDIEIPAGNLSLLVVIHVISSWSPSSIACGSCSS